MSPKDYEEVLQMSENLNSASHVSSNVRRMPSVEERVTSSLWEFMDSVFKKTADDYSFKMEVQEELRSRISEMDVNMIMALYNRLNEHETESHRTALYPFVPKEGKNGSAGQTIVDSLKSTETSAEETLASEADHEVLQGLQQLNALMAALEKTEA